MLKLGGPEEVARERDIYLQLKGIAGIPAIYGSCVNHPTASYISIQPFDVDLYRYVVANGPMCLREACGVVSTLVSTHSSFRTSRYLSVP